MYIYAYNNLLLLFLQMVFGNFLGSKLIVFDLILYINGWVGGCSYLRDYWGRRKLMCPFSDMDKEIESVKSIDTFLNCCSTLGCEDHYSKTKSFNSEFDSDFLKSKQSVQMTQKVCKFSLTNVQLTPRRYLWQMQNSNQNENLKFHISCPENFSQNQNEYSKNLKCCSWTNVAKWKVKVLHFKVNWEANFVVWAWWLGSWAPI